MILVLSREADQDLRSLGEYFGENAQAANKALRAIREILLSLPRFPHLGRSCDEFHRIVPGLRCVTVGAFAIYYRVDSPRVEVGRIIHARRDRERIISRWKSES